jgi:hypothetical protein
MTPVRTAGRASNPRSAPRASQSAKRPSGAVPTAGRSSGGRSAAHGRSMRRRASACARCVPTDRRHDGAGTNSVSTTLPPRLGHGSKIGYVPRVSRPLRRARQSQRAMCAKTWQPLSRARGRAGGARLAGVLRRVLSGQPPTQPQGDSGVRCLQTITRRRRVATERSCPLEGGCDLD